MPAGEHTGALAGNWSECQGVFNMLIRLVARSKQACIHALHEWSLGFLQPSGKSHWITI